MNTEIKEHVLDAKGRKLGRLASEIAVILQGKTIPTTNRVSQAEIVSS